MHVNMLTCFKVVRVGVPKMKVVTDDLIHIKSFIDVIFFHFSCHRMEPI